MSIVAGVDFGTLSVRVSIFDNQLGRLGTGAAGYPLLRKREDPDYAMQRHGDHMQALGEALKLALASAQLAGSRLDAIALDTTGSSVIPVGQGLEPLDGYYLWCDHRSSAEAALITERAVHGKLEAIDWCGGTYSSEWGFSKLLHWLRNNPDKRDQFVTAFEHCDMLTATLCGITDPLAAPRSICAMGHKWMWNPRWGGLPSEEFLSSVDPLLEGLRAKLQGRYGTSDQLAGHLCEPWAARLGLQAGIPIPIGAFDAHWDAIGAGARPGDVVNVVGTSTCIVAVADEAGLIPGVCGVVPGSVNPRLTGIEAGLSATGDIFEAIARRAGQTVEALAARASAFTAGQTGLLRMTWDNGDRTVLVNPHLGGVTFGWNLLHTAEDEFFAAIEGTALHTRIILERMQEHGVPVDRVINTGGIPQRNALLNQVYANVFNKPVLVPDSDVTSLGSAIFAFLAAGAFPSLEAAQAKLCPSYRIFSPNLAAARAYDQLYAIYRKLYFGLGRANAPAVAVGDVLPELRRISSDCQRHA